MSTAKYNVSFYMAGHKRFSELLEVLLTRFCEKEGAKLARRSNKHKKTKKNCMTAVATPKEFKYTLYRFRHNSSSSV